jgi:hypothetical protein
MVLVDSSVWIEALPGDIKVKGYGGAFNPG